MLLITKFRAYSGEMKAAFSQSNKENLKEKNSTEQKPQFITAVFTWVTDIQRLFFIF